MVPSPWGMLPGWLIYPFAAFLGASLGSFANVMIYRIPEEKSIVRPPSKCPACGKQIRAIDNVPVLSWLMLRGKCRDCGNRISIQYPLVEACCGGLALLNVLLYGISYQTLAFTLLYIGLLALIIIDLRHWLLPFVITIPLTIVGLAGAVFFDLLPIKDSLIGMIAGFGVFLVMLLGGKWLFKKEAMGGGDVVFGLMAGAFLGWKATLLMIFVASLIGTVMALFMMILGKGIAGKSVPFGPFLAVAVVICLHLADPLIGWYIRLFTP